MTNRVDLYSATGVLRDGKPYKICKIEKLITRGHAQWITKGVSAQLLYWTDEELEAERLRMYQRAGENRSDAEPHKGQWAVVQPQPDQAGPSGWQLRHPRVNEGAVLLPLAS